MSNRPVDEHVSEPRRDGRRCFDRNDLQRLHAGAAARFVKTAALFNAVLV
jgi:hypothetical protein